MNNLYLVTAPHSFLYDGKNSPEAQTDEVFSGWAVRASGEEEDGWLPVETHYGYTGWMRCRDLGPTDPEELTARVAEIRTIREPWSDLMDKPSVVQQPRVTLPRGSLVQLLPDPEQDGWLKIRETGGREGWVRTEALKPRRDDDEYLIRGERDHAWFTARLQAWFGKQQESALRQAAVENALSRLGTPYRWGGKGPAGIDCSGLVFMSWMEAGVLFYRDASIEPGFPVHEIPREELKPGDLIFFPGHVALYLGEGRYIHATAYAKTPRVTLNSLRPEDPDYRQDLAEKVTACGTVFPKTNL